MLIDEVQNCLKWLRYNVHLNANGEEYATYNKALDKIQEFVDRNKVDYPFVGADGKYHCPTCGIEVNSNQSRCPICDQKLGVQECQK